MVKVSNLTYFFFSTIKRDVIINSHVQLIVNKQMWSILNSLIKKADLKIVINTGLGLVSLVISSKVQALTTDLTGTIRDFCFVEITDTCIDHPDFEQGIGGLETGIVESIIDSDRKPIYAQGDGTSSLTTNGETFFDQWYRDVPGVNTSTPFTITLDNTITPDLNVFTFIDPNFFPIEPIWDLFL